MRFQSKRRIPALIIGDFSLFALALWVALLVRYARFPSVELFLQHLAPFILIFLIWILVFYIADLYGKHTSIFLRKLPRIIFNSQIANSVLAVVFFYFIPYFGITPKTILFIDLFFSFLFIFVWRNYVIPNLHLGQREKILFTCKGEEVDEIIEEVKNNPKYDIAIATPSEVKDVEKSGVTSIVVNLYDEGTAESRSDFYQLIFSGIRFVSIHSLYEEFFDRIPLSLLKEQWFLENISNSSKLFYDLSKRTVDILVSAVFGLITLVVYPFVYLAIKLEDGGPVFISQQRIGQGNKIITLYKFRSMTGNESGKWVNEGSLKVTKVGWFLRKTRIDEFPQLWNVIKGDLSLVGPRPDIVGLDKRLSEEIPYYSSRTLVPPGLSGWAQINQDKPPQSVEETKKRLSYDLYYIKNRSFFLDFKIVLRTIKTLLSRSGV